MKDIIIIGGGLAGLTASYLLAKARFDVLLIEKKEYPFHKVCGEYISNEAVPFLKQHGLYPNEHKPAAIGHFQLSNLQGASKIYPLDLGGFGISRYLFDHFLYDKCREAGVDFHLKCQVDKLDFAEDVFHVRTTSGATYLAPLVIGAFGKRSALDKKLDRTFTQKRSPYIGVKYHIETDFPKNVIAIHGFEKGYCGLVKIEDDKYNLCYLVHRDLLKISGNIRTMEETFLYKNPLLKNIFKNSRFLFDKPEVINEISFSSKSPVENHILMAGDAAGMVAPIFGNGMAMAIRAGKTLADVISVHYSAGKLPNRDVLEKEYAATWNKLFAKRLWLGRRVQQVFDNTPLTNALFKLMLTNKYLLKFLMKHSHGEVF